MNQVLASLLVANLYLGVPRSRGFSPVTVAVIYAGVASVAGVLALLVQGLILQTWLIFVVAGAIVGSS